mgnify:CR=1 FL=1
MSASIVSRPCLAAAAASRARLVSRAARASTASSSSNDKLHAVGARALPIQVRGLAQIARAKKGGFMAEMEEAKAEESGAKVEFTLPLAIQKYPHASLRNDNKIVGVFDAELEKLAQAMFKIMYETEGVGLAAPQVGVNYRMMVYNEAGEPGRGKEVVLVNQKGERLLTEHLIWSHDSDLVHTTRPVEIETQQGVLRERGLRADSQFERYEILAPTGSFDLGVQEPEGKNP